MSWVLAIDHFHSRGPTLLRGASFLSQLCLLLLGLQGGQWHPKSPRLSPCMLRRLEIWGIGQGEPAWASSAWGQWSRRLGAGLLLSEDKTSAWLCRIVSVQHWAVHRSESHWLIYKRILMASPLLRITVKRRANNACEMLSAEEACMQH